MVKWFFSLLFFAGLVVVGDAANADVVQSSIARFLSTAAKDRTTHGIAWDCIAAAALVEKNDQRFLHKLRRDALELQARAIRSQVDWSVIGWTNNLTERKCRPSDNSPCRGDKIVYAYQTGLASTCLSTAARLLDASEFLEPVEQALKYWDDLKTLAKCDGCSYFRISDSAEDSARYIRNMNVTFAAGLAAYARASGREIRRGQALDAIQSDFFDRSLGFFGYVGALDEKANEAEKGRIENHLASMALLLSRAASDLGDPGVYAHAFNVWRDWASCQNQLCKTKGCKFWAADADVCIEPATAVHCVFREVDSYAREQCATYVEKVRAIQSLGILAILQGELGPTYGDR